MTQHRPAVTASVVLLFWLIAERRRLFQGLSHTYLSEILGGQDRLLGRVARRRSVEWTEHEQGVTHSRPPVANRVDSQALDCRDRVTAKQLEAPLRSRDG